MREREIRGRESVREGYREGGRERERKRERERGVPAKMTGEFMTPFDIPGASHRESAREIVCVYV